MVINSNDNLIQKESLEFAFMAINLSNELQKNPINQILIRQFFRSATSIGANVEEALGGHTRNDFIHSMNIAKKEARETLYWLKLLLKANFKNKSNLEIIEMKCVSLINILTKIVKTSKNK